MSAAEVDVLATAAASPDAEGSKSALETWCDALQANPTDPAALDFLALAFKRGGDAAWVEAIGFIARGPGPKTDRAAALRAIERHAPARARIWNQFSAAFEQTGDIEHALAALDRTVELGSASVNSHERRDRLVQAGRPSPASGPKILVIGNCQALGVATCLRRLCPTSTVMGELWADYQAPEIADRFLETIAGYDLVISQSFGRPPQAFSRDMVAERASRFVGLPRLFFTGYHPDLIRTLNPTSGPASPFRAWHSAIIAACSRLRLPPDRTRELFNAYIYGVLGYFDGFDTAEQLQIAEGERAGLDLRPLLEQWKAGGAFVHLPDHPKIGALHSMARAICEREAIDIDAEADAPHDIQAERAVWPVYPEIARRRGAEGSLEFIPHHPSDLQTLDQVIRQFYGFYAQTGGPTDPRVAQTADILRREIA